MRHPGRHWLVPRYASSPGFAIVVLDEAGLPVETVVGWVTEALAEGHAQSRYEVGRYRIVPTRPPGKGVAPLSVRD